MSVALIDAIHSGSVSRLIAQQPTSVVVNSEGGDIYSALTLLAYMQATRCRLIVAGQCSSSACYLLALDSELVSIGKGAYGVQHKPKVLVPKVGHPIVESDPWVKSAREHWHVDHKVYLAVLGKNLSETTETYLTSADLYDLNRSELYRESYGFHKPKLG